jgi:hypothetical protein
MSYYAEIVGAAVSLSAAQQAVKRLRTQEQEDFPVYVLGTQTPMYLQKER